MKRLNQIILFTIVLICANVSAQSEYNKNTVFTEEWVLNRWKSVAGVEMKFRPATKEYYEEQLLEVKKILKFYDFEFGEPLFKNTTFETALKNANNDEQFLDRNWQNDYIIVGISCTNVFCSISIAQYREHKR